MRSMATPPKRSSTATRARSAKPTVAASGPPAKPFLRVYHSVELQQKTLRVLATVESARDPTAHRADLTNLATELTSSGLHYCFVKPLKDAKAGFVLEQSASVGLVGVQQVMATVIRNIIARMDGPQLLSVCHSLRQFMR
jgi:hypothetical protein